MLGPTPLQRLAANKTTHVNFYCMVDCVDGADIANPAAALFFQIAADAVYVQRNQLRIRDASGTGGYFNGHLRKAMRRDANLVGTLLVWSDSDEAAGLFAPMPFLRGWLRRGFLLLKTGAGILDAFQFGTAAWNGKKRRGPPKIPFTLAEDLQRLAWLLATTHAKESRGNGSTIKTDWSLARKKMIAMNRTTFADAGKEKAIQDIDAAIKKAKGFTDGHYLAQDVGPQMLPETEIRAISGKRAAIKIPD